MTYEEAVYYLEHASAFGIQLGLGRMEQLLARLHNPQDRYKTIHVTGTNGKGSVTAMIASALHQAGFRTGRYTSPHLEAYTERICIDEGEISQADFAEAVAVVSHEVEAIAAAGGERPTEFEMLTAAAFWYFAKARVDYAVIEVGLGGLLDSTNVITPVVSVITNVAMDHMKYCGNTLEEIAAQKAGIIKSGVPVVTTAEKPGLSVIAATAYEKHSRLYALGHSFTIKAAAPPDAQGQVLTLQEHTGRGRALTVDLPLLGEHQQKNCAAALMALLLVARQEKRLTKTAIAAGIHQVRWPGRFQVLKAGEQDIVIDGAHNPAGIDTFCRTYEQVFGTRQRVFLFSVLADKDYTQMVQTLFRPDDYVICAPAPTPRSADPREIARILPCRADWAPSLEKALDQALQAVRPDQVLCIVGSLYIQGDVRRHLRNFWHVTL